MKELNSFELSPLPRRWTLEEDNQSRVSAVLALDPLALHLFAEIQGSPTLPEKNIENTFVEGLWKSDVIELFVREKDSDCYQEFNLAAGGLWWTAGFTSYRKRNVSLGKPNGVQTSFQQLEHCWHVSLSIPKSELYFAASFSNTTQVNLCAILGTDPRSYYSYADLCSSEPDFHRCQDFPATELKKM